MELLKGGICDFKRNKTTAITLFKTQLLPFVDELIDTVPSTQSQKREVGTITLWPHARVC